MSLPLLALLSLATPQTDLAPIIDTEVHALNVTIDGADRVEVQLPKFDEGQGALVGVRLYLRANVHRGLLVENTTPGDVATTMQVTGEAGVVVYGENPFVLDLVNATFTHSERLDAYDGNLDFQGPSALGLHLQAATNKHTSTLGWGYEECREYVSTTKEKSLQLTLQTVDLTRVLAPGAEIAVDRILAEATLMIEYLYAPLLDDIVIVPGGPMQGVATDAPERIYYADRPQSLPGIGTLP